MNNVCPKTNLEKHWKRLRMTTTVDGQVSVRAIAKTFASGKTEKLVYQTLAECGLPNGKVNMNILIAIGFSHCIVSLHGKRLWDRYPAFAMSEETFAAFPYRLMSYDTLAGYEAIHIKLCIRTESPLLNSLNDRIEAIDPNLLEHYAAGAAVGFWLSNFGTVDGLVSPLASLRSPGYHPVNWQWQERPWCYTFFSVLGLGSL